MTDPATTAPDSVVRETFIALFAGDLTRLDDHPALAPLRQALPALRSAFPDLTAELEQQVVNGDRVATHWILRGTHLGDLYGLGATGKTVQFQNLSICRVEAGRIIQYNSEVGFLSVFRQLGVLPLRATSAR
jgi:predicted ester cyclase